MRTAPTLRDEQVQGGAHVPRVELDADPGLAPGLEQDKAHAPVCHLLVPRERSPGGLAIDLHRPGSKDVLDHACVVLEAGQPQSRDKPERNRATVGKRVPGRGLERMPECVAEVELSPIASIERIAETDASLERGAASYLLCGLQLPDRLAGEQAGLHDFGEPVPELLRGKRRQKARSRAPPGEASPEAPDR